VSALHRLIPYSTHRRPEDASIARLAVAPPIATRRAIDEHSQITPRHGIRLDFIATAVYQIEGIAAVQLAIVLGLGHDHVGAFAKVIVLSSSAVECRLYPLSGCNRYTFLSDDGICRVLPKSSEAILKYSVAESAANGWSRACVETGTRCASQKPYYGFGMLPRFDKNGERFKATA